MGNVNKNAGFERMHACVGGSMAGPFINQAYPLSKVGVRQYRTQRRMHNKETKGRFMKENEKRKRRKRTETARSCLNYLIFY
jgi:hypothetical protein